MAPLAGENAEPWITVAAAAELGAPRATLYRKVQLGKIPSRIREDGEREVLVAALPPLVQQKYLERAAQARRAHADAVDEALAQREVIIRLRQHPPEVAERLRPEVKRRYDLLLRLWAIRGPRTVSGEVAPEVAAILAEWPSRDLELTRLRPGWARPISFSRLRRLAQRVRRSGAGVLVPGTSRVLRKTDRRVRAIDAEILNAAARLRLDRPKATQVHLYRALVKKFGRERMPSRRTFEGLLPALVPESVRVLAGEGPKTYRAKIAPAIYRDRTQLDVFDWLCGDHHRFDLMVINPKRRGHLDRPWLTMLLDEKSRAPAGYCISFEANSSTIRSALRAAMEPKREPVLSLLCGKPRRFYIDNGKDFRANALELEGTGVFFALGIEVTHALPYNARAKVVERFFGTVATDFSRRLPGYCGSDPSEKSEIHEAKVKAHAAVIDSGRPLRDRNFMTLDELRDAFRFWMLEEYLQREHEGLFDAVTGRKHTPAAIIQERRQPPIVVPSDELAFVMMDATKRRVRQCSISIGRHHYHADELRVHEGEWVTCRVDEKNVKNVHVSSLKGEPICWAECVELSLVHPNGDLSKAAIAGFAKQERARAKDREREREILERGTDTIEGYIAAHPPLLPPATPAPAAAPPEAVIELRPDRKRVAAHAAAERPSSESELPPAAPMRVLPRDGEELSDEEWVTRELGEPRPVIKPWDDERTRRRLEEKTAVYDELALQLLATRHQPRSKQGGSPT